MKDSRDSPEDGRRIAPFAGPERAWREGMHDHEDGPMPDTASPVRRAGLSDAELLSLYLSLPPAPREKIFVSTAQAAKITGVSTRTIQLWIEYGAVRAILVGRKYRILLDSLRAHLELQMHKQINTR
jgi:excisionase family DNA binding protein